jgi:hypothetical protein
MKISPEYSRFCAGALFVTLGGFVAGCATTDQQVTTVVRDASVTGPLFSPAVHPVTDAAKNTLTLSAHVSAPRSSTINGVIVGSEPEKSPWLYPVDSVRLAGGGIAAQRQVPRYNLSWKQPGFSAGMNLDFMWNSVALTLGGSVANTSGRNLYGWSAGLGFFTSESKTVRARLDAGVFGQSLYYDARSVTITNTKTTWLFGGSSTTIDTAFYHDYVTESSIGYYGTVTINSAFPSSPVNFFLQGSLVSQPVLEYEPYSRTTINWVMFAPVEVSESGGSVSTHALLFGVTPGIFIEPSDNLVMLVGVRCLFDMSDTFTGDTSTFIPFVQIGLRTGL